MKWLDAYLWFNLSSYWNNDNPKMPQEAVPWHAPSLHLTSWQLAAEDPQVLKIHFTLISSSDAGANGANTASIARIHKGSRPTVSLSQAWAKNGRTSSPANITKAQHR